MRNVEFQTVAPESVDVDELLEFYERQSHNVTGCRDKLRRMIERSDCFVTARQEGRLIGLARGLTDGVRGYLAECKLDPDCQGPAAVTRIDGRIEHDERGIGREMALRVLEALREQGVEQVFVTAYGTEEDFLAELGFRRTRGMLTMQMSLCEAAVLQAVS